MERLANGAPAYVTRENVLFLGCWWPSFFIQLLQKPDSLDVLLGLGFKAAFA